MGYRPRYMLRYASHVESLSNRNYKHNLKSAYVSLTYISLAGVPVLCSCGVTGEFNHSTNEYAYVNSLFARTKIFATIITHLNNWK